MSSRSEEKELKYERKREKDKSYHDEANYDCTCSCDSSPTSAYFPPHSVIRVYHDYNSSSRTKLTSKTFDANSKENGDPYLETWRVGPQIGHGSHADVFLAYRENSEHNKTFNNSTKFDQIALKVEPLDVKNPTLAYEYQILDSLRNLKGIPFAHFYVEEENMAMIGLQLLGPSLEDLLSKYKQLSVPTVAEIGEQLVRIFQTLHQSHYIHRSIKPENFCIGSGAEESSEIFLIDFGRCTYYRDPETLIHIPYDDETWRYGEWTSVFSSLNSDKGIEKSRRDDLEAVAHMLFYFLRGKLPWQKYYKDSKRIRKKKRRYPIEDLLILDDSINYDRNYSEEGKRLPNEFLLFLKHTRSLRFDDEPNYDYLIRLMRRVSQNRELDWKIHERSNCIDEISDYDYNHHKNERKNFNSRKRKLSNSIQEEHIIGQQRNDNDSTNEFIEPPKKMLKY